MVITYIRFLSKFSKIKSFVCLCVCVCITWNGFIYLLLLSYRRKKMICGKNENVFILSYSIIIDRFQIDGEFHFFYINYKTEPKIRHIRFNFKFWFCGLLSFYIVKILLENFLMNLSNHHWCPLQFCFQF